MLYRIIKDSPISVEEFFASINFEFYKDIKINIIQDILMLLNHSSIPYILQTDSFIFTLDSDIDRTILKYEKILEVIEIEESLELLKAFENIENVKLWQKDIKDD